jgi:hypothetical protein
MLNIYKFIQLQISKSIEYRADEQAAKIVGGKNMAHALSFLSSNGYFSIFSTHPTTANRVKNVDKLESTSSTIRPVFGVNLTFLASFAIMAAACYFSYKLANVDSIIMDYRNMVLFFKNKYIVITGNVRMFINKHFNK